MKRREFIFSVVAIGLVSGMTAPAYARHPIIDTIIQCVKHPKECIAKLASSDASPKAPSEAPPRKSDVLATVRDEEITVSDFKWRLAQISPAHRSAYLTPEGRQSFLQSIIEQRLIVVSARHLQMDHDASIRQKLALQEEALFKQTLQNRLGVVSEKEIQQYYRAHQEDFGPRWKVKVSRMTVRIEADAKKALGLLKRGTSFADVCKLHGTTPVPVQEQMSFPAGPKHQKNDMEKALSGISKRGYTTPMKTSSGYVILRKDDEQIIPMASSYEQVKIQIKALLEDKKISLWLEAQRPNHSVHINEELLQATDLSIKPNK